ncbi:MAG TPA: AraC family transcriptional regulator [Candidatus Acidoferrum sp.]|nr:AraC family transcriptional regulator [Candidatus Acidoferrum sp.]
MSLPALAPHAARRIELGATDALRVSLLSDPPGFVEFRGSDRIGICIHAGPPVYALCRHGKEQHRGTVIYGDVDIIPPHTPATWELKGVDIDLVISVKQDLLHAVVMDSGGDPQALEIRSRFQARDTQIEHISWAIKAEMESGYPCGRLYMDSLATALAARIVGGHSSLSLQADRHNGKMSDRKLRRVLGFIEEHLGQDIALRQLADVAGLSVSHFKVVFNRSVGVPAHQYVIRRRVERAATLLREGTLPIAQIAVETGFCHQSHLAMHMRRILGASPRHVRQASL